MRRRAIVAGLLLGLVACARQAPARVTLIGALPSLGRQSDLRQTSGFTSPVGEWLVYQSYSYRFANRKFNGQGRVAGLGFDQAIAIANAPTSLTYGATERLSLGFTLSPLNTVHRTIGVTNFSPGASLLGQLLPVGQSTQLVQRGSGVGDLNLNLQYRLSAAGDPLSSFLSLDAIVPTAPSDPKSQLDFAIGQGFYSIIPGLSFSYRDGPWQYFLRLTYELTTEFISVDPRGVRSVDKAGEGGNLTAGLAFKLHRNLTAHANVIAATRGSPAANGVLEPDQQYRTVELRPGITLEDKKVKWSLDTYVPVSGANILRTTGLFASAGVSF